ncbi:hypothetical protein [Nocardia paucivorans]|uniref:hypothetical protein n=1 Tax=Nocardia paucivorans TaxID=114259 RepID=UPI00031808B4|nr:hypothetical protein [Nocardia paucivorans]
MTLPQRRGLPDHEKGRMSFLHYVPHSVILHRIVEHLRSLENAPAPGRETR